MIMLLMNIIAWLLHAIIPVWALDLEVESKDSVCAATALIQQGMLDYYAGDKYGGAVGMFP